MSNQLGQDTGNDRLGNGREAAQLLKLICSAGKAAVLEHCGEKASQFVSEEVERLNATVTHFGASGKQVFWLRDIKDKLVEKGLI